MPQAAQASPPGSNGQGLNDSQVKEFLVSESHPVSFYPTLHEQ